METLCMVRRGIAVDGEIPVATMPDPVDDGQLDLNDPRVRRAYERGLVEGAMAQVPCDPTVVQIYEDTLDVGPGDDSYCCDPWQTNSAGSNVTNVQIGSSSGAMTFTADHCSFSSTWCLE